MKKTQNKQRKTLLLLKNKGKQGLFRAIFSRFGLVLLLLAAQVGLMLGFYVWFEEFLPHFLGGTLLVTVPMLLYLLNSRLDPSAKITWLVVFLLMPFFGALFFWFTQSNLGHRALKDRIDHLLYRSRNAIEQEPEVQRGLEEENPGAGSLVKYIQRTACHPICDGTDVTYYSTGEDMFEAIMNELEQARHYIFLEYFIVEEGLMWGQMLDLLARKAAQGVEIRMMYDGTCEFTRLPRDYPKLLQNLGIQCRVFAAVKPFLSTHYNYRDHRKILVIDGHTAFTGGINLADEYINHVSRFGYWKDTGLMLKGPAAQSLMLMFLQLWSVTDHQPDFQKYLSPVAKVPGSKGYVIPYGDCPLDDEKLGERVYMDLLNRAQRYVHIMTPYLILDGELETALRFAAERGVEVRLILPGIPDQKSAHLLAKTHLPALVDSGVRVYSYIPGFLHAKVMICDDEEAVVGTINMDYRSLYHHFECAAYLVGVPCIQDIEKDFQETLRQSQRITRQTIREDPWYEKLGGLLLKAIAPLL